MDWPVNGIVGGLTSQRICWWTDMPKASLVDRPPIGHVSGLTCQRTQVDWPAKGLIGGLTCQRHRKRSDHPKVDWPVRGIVGGPTLHRISWLTDLPKASLVNRPSIDLFGEVTYQRPFQWMTCLASGLICLRPCLWTDLPKVADGTDLPKALLVD